MLWQRNHRRGQFLAGGVKLMKTFNRILILGATITALGTWWVPLRAAVMRALPAFPGKTSLPPYASAS